MNKNSDLRVAAEAALWKADLSVAVTSSPRRHCRCRSVVSVLAGQGLIGLAALALLPQTLNATTTVTTTAAVTATVQATCLVSATGMAFGTYTGVVATATSTITVTCTNTTPYNVGISAGLATGATVTTRQMSGPSSSLLNYALYSNAGRTTNWGVTVGTDTVAGTGNGAAQVLTVYGQVAAGQYVTPGSFTDTVTATVTY